MEVLGTYNLFSVTFGTETLINIQIKTEGDLLLCLPNRIKWT